MTRIPLSEIMVRDSSYGTGNLKRRLIDNELLDYSCSLCGISRWRGAEISLHLDHINGNSRDHRLENLRLLRPNCHSQTDTYAGRNSRVTHNCPDCGIRISEKGRRCQSCANLNYCNTPWPDDPKVVLDQVRKDGYEATGKRYGVWGNTVKKYLKRNSLFKDLKLNG